MKQPNRDDLVRLLAEVASEQWNEQIFPLETMKALVTQSGLGWCKYSYQYLLDHPKERLEEFMEPVLDLAVGNILEEWTIQEWLDRKPKEGEDPQDLWEWQCAAVEMVRTLVPPD